MTLAIRSAVAYPDPAAWPIQRQGVNECGCVAAANALNLLAGRLVYAKDDLVREAGIFFQRRLGGTPSPVTGWLLRRHGAGTHFGNLRDTDADTVLRDLIDRGALAVVEIGENRLGPFTIYGRHAILLIGYAAGADGTTAEYYVVDSEWPDEPGRQAPGNRTIGRAEFAAQFTTGIYFPVFRNQAEHDAWYWVSMRVRRGPPLLSALAAAAFSGSRDIWIGVGKQTAPSPAMLIR